MISTDENGDAVFWNLPEKSIRRTFIPHNGRVTSVSFAPDGRYFVTTGVKEGAKIWQSDQLSGAAILLPHTGPVLATCISPDGKTVYTGTEAGIILVWNDNGVRLDSLKQENGEVAALAFDPLGRYFLSGDEKGIIRFWDPAGRRVFHQLHDTSGPVRQLFVDHSGRYVLSVTAGKASDVITSWQYDEKKPPLQKKLRE
jgi:WD40 repeat protein